ncbi:Ig-like domain-containing protein [Paracoccus binzhouensis]|uniref:Ig-like domain-containing protein n=1 Tax=Paracoccus binzhouensis TaxID=2796149 RepID=UPI0018EF0724|nr:Ig-like domain-containing protein [Paracoccus binzhouensis]
MRIRFTLGTFFLAALFAASAAQAECTGSNGRGWGSGKGAGKFEMTAADKVCRISFPGFIDDVRKTRTPATEVVLTKAPSHGKLGIAPGEGLVYTPAQGFRGSDKFCTRNKAPEISGKTLSGCITVTVR